MKKNIIKFIAIFLMLLTTFLIFFKFHLVSDAYRIIDLDNNYLTNLKLVEGRPIQALYFFILSKLEFEINSMNTYMLIYKINLLISITLLTISIYLIYKTIIKYINDKNNRIYILVVIMGIGINISICEYLLFIENFIIIIGLLLTVISGIVLYSNMKYKNIYSFFFLVLSTFCYQGVSQFFVIFSFLLLISSNYNNDILTKKQKLISIIKILVIYILSLSCNYVVSYIFNKVLPNLDPRLFTGIFNGFDYLVSGSALKIIEHYGIYFILVFVLNYRIFFKKDRYNYILNLLMLFLLSIVSFIPFLINNTCGLMPRTLLNYSVIYFVVELYIISLKDVKMIKFNIIVICFILIYNIFNIALLEKCNFYSTKQNITEVNKIIEIIEKYEENNNIKIEKINFYDDKELNLKYWNSEISIFSTYCYPIYYGYWCDIYSIDVLSGRKFNKSSTENLDMYDYFKSKNWDEPNFDEQIIFKDNTAHICRF